MGVIEVVKKQKLEKEREKGLEQGLEQGREQGLEQGREQGREQGLEQRSTEVVKNLITELKLTDEQIARIAEVTVDFVQNIRKELDK